MATPIFTLEALQAAHGDALLLHYGDAGDPRLIVIDGGPAGIYKASLEPRLKQIRTARGGGALDIRMLMVSHIDDDHLAGLLDLMKALRKLHDDGRPLPYDILTLWHNSFDDIVSSGGAGLTAALQTATFSADQGDAAAIAASVKQGRQLRQDADALAINMNSGFDDLIAFEPGTRKLKISKNLTFRVLGPRQSEIEALEHTWDTYLTDKGLAANDAAAGGAVAAEFLDTSVANLASLVVVAESGGKKMLLTGDARGDHILASLKQARLLRRGTFAVDIFKLPHHGSDRNGGVALFKAVPAAHYVVSADGKHGNPDVGTFEELFTARPTGSYDIWLTNPVPDALDFLESHKPGGVTIHARAAAERSVKVELLNPIEW